ncbi:MAG: DNA glycosylase AlkZ-like family protein [Actinomycetota bacterium]
MLAWRLRRQYLDPLTDAGPLEIVSRLCGVQAQVASSAELAVRLRQRTLQPAAMPNALLDRSLVKTWAMRGTLHICRSAEVTDYLGLIAAAQTWTKPTWERHFGATAQGVSQLAESVKQILDGTVLSRDQLVTELVRDNRFATMAGQLRSGWGALLKPLAWQGVLCYGPNRGSIVTFTNPASFLPSWGGLPEVDGAAPRVIARYLGAFGPATAEVFDAWLTRGSHTKPHCAGGSGIWVRMSCAPRNPATPST